MKKISFWLGGLCLLVSSSTFAKINYPCSGTPGAYHTNPDSTLGGFVATTATVDPTVYIELEASVCERATVMEGARIMDRAEVGGRSMVRGKVHVSGRAKVYGDAYLINLHGSELEVRDDAKVFGNGFLQGSVIVADTSQVFGWGKIIGFAQVLGDSRVCGGVIIQGFEIITDDHSKCDQGWKVVK